MDVSEPWIAIRKVINIGWLFLAQASLNSRSKLHPRCLWPSSEPRHRPPDDYQTFLPHVLTFEFAPTPICCQIDGPLPKPDGAMSFSGTRRISL